MEGFIAGSIVGIYGAFMYYVGFVHGREEGLKAVVAKALKERR